MNDTREADHRRLKEMGLWYAITSDSEAAARLVMLGFLDVRLGDSAPKTPLEFAKAAIIRDAIGDNRNASAVARLLGLRRSESAVKFVNTSGWAKTLERVVRKNQGLLDSVASSGLNAT
jgi:hypothetical protein